MCKSTWNSTNGRHERFDIDAVRDLCKDYDLFYAIRDFIFIIPNGYEKDDHENSLNSEQDFVAITNEMVVMFDPCTNNIKAAKKGCLNWKEIPESNTMIVALKNHTALSIDIDREHNGIYGYQSAKRLNELGVKLEEIHSLAAKGIVFRPRGIPRYNELAPLPIPLEQSVDMSDEEISKLTPMSLTIDI